MKYEKLLNRLKKEYPEYFYKDLVTIDDIYKALSDYSKQGVFNFVNKAIKCGDLKPVERGVYCKNKNKVVTPMDIVDKKYIGNTKEIYGIYGRLGMESNFLISNQIANTIDVITNKTSSKRRVIKVGYQKVILYKSRCKITKDNYAAYTLLELFNSFDITKFNKDVMLQVKQYAKNHKISKKMVNSIIPFFPSKSIKNMYISGAMNVLA